MPSTIAAPSPQTVAALDRIEHVSQVTQGALRAAGHADLAQAESDRLDYLLRAVWAIPAGR